MKKHTPGPWQVTNMTMAMSDYFAVDCAHPDLEKHDKFPQDYWPDQICTHIEMKADARLIAAAPDLLEALISILEYDGEDAYEWDRRQDNAHKALAKATGVVDIVGERRAAIAKAMGDVS